MDPAFVTLGSVPFLLIRGLPRVAALQACFIHSHTLNRKYHSAPLSDNGGAGVSGASSTPVAFYTAPDNRTNGNVAVGVRIGPGVQCLMALPYRLPSNLTALDGAGGVTAAAQGVIQNSLVSMGRCELVCVCVSKCVRVCDGCMWVCVERYVGEC